MATFTTRLRVRHYEMDSLGHVNNAVYLHYLEQVAFEHSESLGFDLPRYAEIGGVFVLRKLEVEYLRPSVAGDTLELTTWIQEMRGPRAVRRYEVRKQGAPELVVTAEALWIWVDAATMRPRVMPHVLIDAFLDDQETE
ncbi:MAG: acyl-CoA thioesterase [Herpetosiphonaceae bacterium]|nr:acyl-CoA thioesterase [Herpetosiphonaceae bacterium]